MIQIAVCDDEKYYRDKIRELAAQFLEKRQLPYTVTVYPSGEDFLAGEENLVKYDIVFLDISMKDIDGIETAMRIRSFHSGTCIVFVTAFPDYVLDGYKADAVRYLMKDSLGTEMEECMAAVLERMELRQVAFPFTGGVRDRPYTLPPRHLPYSAGRPALPPLWDREPAVPTAGAQSFMSFPPVTF